MWFVILNANMNCCCWGIYILVIAGRDLDISNWPDVTHFELNQSFIKVYVTYRIDINTY